MATIRSEQAGNLLAAPASRLTPLTMRFLRRLTACAVFTFPAFIVLAQYAVPGIVRLCAAGNLRGFAGVLLLQIWIVTLVDMWRHVVWDFLQICARRYGPQVSPLDAASETAPEI
jgi:hypothetical protein